MGFNRFYLSVALLCALLFASAYLFFYFLTVRLQPSTAAGFALFSLLVSYLTYLHEKDPSLYYTVRYVNRNFRDLHVQLERLIEEFKENRINLEVQAHYLEALMDNVSIGIISFNMHGEIRTMNRPAREILECGSPDNIGDMDRVSAGTGKLLQELGPGEEHTLALRQNGKEIQLAVSCSEIRLKNDYFRIVALNNITHQMEEQEIAPPPDLSEFPVSELFGRVRSLFEEDLLVQGIGLHWKLEEAPRIGEGRSIGEDCRIRADRQMMEQVLINLIRNSAAALQGTPEATIELSCEKASPGKTMLVVQDNGDGIPEDKLEQVFVPYFSTRQGGSGIGLSLCRQILRLHRGEIRIQSEEGSGTRVEIQLPSGRL